MRKMSAVISLLCLVFVNLLPLSALAAASAPPPEPYERVAAKSGSWYADQLYYDGKSNLVVGYTGSYKALADETELQFTLGEKIRLTGIYIPYPGQVGSVELHLTDSRGNIYQGFTGYPTVTSGSIADEAEEGESKAEQLHTLYVFRPDQDISLPRGSYSLHLTGQTLPVDAYLVKGYNYAAWEAYREKLKKWAAAGKEEEEEEEASFGEAELRELLRRFEEGKDDPYEFSWTDTARDRFAPVFVLETDHVIDEIILNTWNGGQGAAPGAIYILDKSGRAVGAYRAQGARLGNVPNALWICYPDLLLPAGIYTIDMTDPDALAFDEQGEPVFYVSASLPVRAKTSFTGTYKVNLDVYKTSTLMGPVAGRVSSFSLKDYELTVLDKGSMIELIGQYEGMPFSQNCKVTERTEEAVTAVFSFSADLTKLPYKARIGAEATVTLVMPQRGMAIIGVEGTGTYERGASAEKGADYNTYDIVLSGQMTTRALPPFVMAALGKLGGAGNIPGPDTPAQAAAGMLFPPLVGVIVHILQERLKPKPRAAVRRDKEWYRKKYPGRTDEELAIIMMADALGSTGGDPEDRVSVGDNEIAQSPDGTAGADYDGGGYDGDEDYSFGKPDVPEDKPAAAPADRQPETGQPGQPELPAEPETMEVITSQYGATTLIMRDPTTGQWVNAETGNPFDLERHLRESPDQFKRHLKATAHNAELERTGQTAMQQALAGIKDKYRAEFEAIQKEINQRRMEQLRRDQEWAEWEQARAQQGLGHGRIIGQTAANIGGEFVEAGKTIGRGIGRLASEAAELGRDLINDPSILVNTYRGTVDDINKGLDYAGKSLIQAGKDIYRNPEIITETLKGTGKDLAAGAKNIGKAVIDTVTDPKKAWEFIKNTSGIENFENSLDPNRSLLERIGEVGKGTMKLASTLLTAGKAGSALKSGAGKLSGLADDLLGAGSKSLTGKTAVTGIKPTLPVRTGPGYVNTGRPANLSGVTRTSQKIIQNTADDFGVQIHTRRTTASADAWINSGKAVPKEMDLKAKTLDWVDELLGGPKNSEGLVGYYKPKLPPKEVMKSLSEDTQKLIVEKFKDRSREFRKLAGDMEALKDKYAVIDGRVMDLQKGGKFVTGDVDLLDITNFDGTPVSSSLKKQVIDSLMKKTGSNIMHEDVMSWSKDGKAFNLQAKIKMLNDARAPVDPTKAAGGISTYNPLATPTTSYQSGPRIDMAQVRNYLNGQPVNLPPDQMNEFMKILKSSGLEV